MRWLEDERNCKAATRNQRLAAVHSFFSFLMVEEPQYIQQSQKILAIPMKKTDKPPLMYLPLDSIKGLLEQPDRTTTQGKRDAVLSYHFRRDKEERMIYALESVKEYHGIAGAKSKLYGPDLNDFKRSLKDLDDILVNPVTIPRRWNIKHFSNPLSAYYDSIYAEQLIPGQEYWARRHIDEILSK